MRPEDSRSYLTKHQKPAPALVWALALLFLLIAAAGVMVAKWL